MPSPVRNLSIFTYSRKYKSVFSVPTVSPPAFFFYVCTAALEKGGDRSGVTSEDEAPVKSGPRAALLS